MELLQTLGIQWTKLIPQFFNFGIVLLVLWKFAYKPVFTMLDARREKIAESVANADKIREQLASTEAERKRILTEAGDEANRLIEQAREAAGRVRETETPAPAVSGRKTLGGTAASSTPNKPTSTATERNQEEVCGGNADILPL